MVFCIFKEGEHITIGIEGGKIKIQGVFGGEVFGEDSSSRRRREVSPKPKLNDGKWHSVVLRRKNGMIKVLVDNIVVATYKLKNPSATFKTGMEIQFSS